jgi:hypothetical protein
VVPADCTASDEQHNHEAALLRIRNFFGTVVSSDEILRHWKT